MIQYENSQEISGAQQSVQFDRNQIIPIRISGVSKVRGISGFDNWNI